MTSYKQWKKCTGFRATALSSISPFHTARTLSPTPRIEHYFGYSSFDYFTDGNELFFYSSARFRMRTAKLFFYPTILSKIVWRLANRSSAQSISNPGSYRLFQFFLFQFHSPHPLARNTRNPYRRVLEGQHLSMRFASSSSRIRTSPSQPSRGWGLYS
jgi:hypothetical protein